MRNAFVVAQFQPLGIDQNQPNLLRRRLVQDGHDHRVDGDALARARGPGDQQMRHASQVGRDDAAIDVLAHRHGELRLRSHELLRLDVLPQENDLALPVRHLNANRAFASHALDQDALRLECEAEIVDQVGDAAVFDAGFRLELERGHDRTGIDLRDLPVNIELGVFRREDLGERLELAGVNRLLFVGTLQQAAGRQFVSAGGNARHRRLGLLPDVPALADFRIRRRFVGARCSSRFFHSTGPGLRACLCRRLLRQHALNPGAPRFCRRLRHGRCRTRLDELRLHDRFGAAPLLELPLLALAGALLPPILVAAPERGNKRKPGGSPELNCRERERGRQIQGSGQNRAAHDVGANKIQIMNQDIANHASQQAFDRDDVGPQDMSRQQGQHGGNKHQQPDGAEDFCQRRLNLHRSKPAHTQGRREQHEQECTHPEKLQRGVGRVGAHDTNPVPGGMGTV